MPHRLITDHQGRTRAVPDIAASPVDGAACAAVAKLLRYFGSRGVPLEPAEMLVMAQAIEAYDLEPDDLRSVPACPVCEEAECDGDCPLAAVRQQDQ